MSDDLQMPQYVSHKKVWALKIKRLERLLRPATNYETVRLHFEDQRFSPVEKDPEYVLRVKFGDDPGYLVVYPDGYESWSPTKAFEEGYSKVDS